MLSREDLNEKIDMVLKALQPRSNNNAISEEEEESNTSFGAKANPTSPMKKLRFGANPQASCLPVDTSLALEAQKVQDFCKQVARFQLQYNERFHTKTNANKCASVALITTVTEMVFMLDKNTLPEVLKRTPGLQKDLQLALMNFLKKFVEMEAEDLAKKYDDIPLQAHRTMVLESHYDNLPNFQQYIEKQMAGKKAHVVTFRFLFPLDDGDVNEALKQKHIKPFTDQIAAVFKLAFMEKNHLTNTNTPGLENKQPAITNTNDTENKTSFYNF